MILLFGPVTLLVQTLGELLMISGTSMLLFQQKKVGFYIIVAGAILTFIVNLIIRANIFPAILSAVANPLITWLLMKKNLHVLK